MTDVFIVNAEAVELDNIWDRLSEARAEKIKRLKSDGQKRLSAAAELALSAAVKSRFPGAAAPVKYYYDKNGKPRLAELDAYISISHSGSFAACAVSDAEIGADIQEVKRVDMRIAERFFAPDEYALLKKSENKSRTFFELWVRKEARVKLTGEGIGGGFSRSDIRGDGVFEYFSQSIKNGKYMIGVCRYGGKNGETGKSKLNRIKIHEIDIDFSAK